MKLHGFPMSPNTRRALVALEEHGIAYELVPVDLMAAEHKGSAYLALNPTGRVPTLVDGDLHLWESNAILDYLAASHPEHGLGGKTPREVGELSRWMFMNAAHLSPNVARIFAHTIRLPPEKRIPQLVDDARVEVDKSLRALEQHLTGRTWIVDRFTNAEVAIAPTLVNAPMLQIDLAPFPAVSAWMARITDRASWKKIYG